MSERSGSHRRGRSTRGLVLACPRCALDLEEPRGEGHPGCPGRLEGPPLETLPALAVESSGAPRALAALPGGGRLERPWVREVGRSTPRPASLDEARAALERAGAGPLRVVLDDPAVTLETVAAGALLAQARVAVELRGPWASIPAGADGLHGVTGHRALTACPGDLAAADLVILLGLDSRDLAAYGSWSARTVTVAVGEGSRSARAGQDDLVLPPCGRLELLRALAQGLVEEHWHRPDVLHQASLGWQAWVAALGERSRDARVRASGVAPAGFQSLLEALARAERQVILWGPAWLAGAEPDEARELGAAGARLAVLSEAVGRPGTGVGGLPGHGAEPALDACGPWRAAGGVEDERPASWLVVSGDPRGAAVLPANVLDDLARAPRRFHLGPVLDAAAQAPGDGEIWWLPTPTPAEDPGTAARVGAFRAVRAQAEQADRRRGLARAPRHWLASLAEGAGAPDLARDLDASHPAALRRRLAEVVPALEPLTRAAPAGMFRWGGERLAERRHFPTPEGRAWLDPRPRPSEAPRP